MLNLCKQIAENETVLKEYCEYVNNLLQENPVCIWNEYKNSPKKSGIYVIRHNDTIIYIGETGCIHDRLVHHKNGNGSALKKKISDYFITEIPEDYLKSCTIQYIPLLLGRAEVEKFLIDKYNPVFNNYNLRKRYRKVKDE